MPSGCCSWPLAPTFVGRRRPLGLRHVPHREALDPGCRRPLGAGGGRRGSVPRRGVLGSSVVASVAGDEGVFFSAAYGGALLAAVTHSGLSLIANALDARARGPETCEPADWSEDDEVCLSGEDGDGEGVLWSVASVLACVPEVNFMSWIFLALQTEHRLLYGTFAALYALPLVHSGPMLDGLDIVTLVVGALHMQLERVSRTEPELVPLPEGTAAEALAGLRVSSKEAMFALRERTATTAAELAAERERVASEGELRMQRERNRAELSAFDQQLEARRGSRAERDD
ncbi:unnamed protein product [Pedinophyceae sp. YPF-701]|nr:unnamed protein product [Pedinophyceae sp. YPF-701]